MAKTVKRAVAVKHPETQQSQWFYPGDKLPAWAEEIVTNDRAFREIGDEDAIQQPDSASEDPFAPGTDDGPVNYEDMTNHELELLLEERGLATSGNKKEKIERLQMDDGAHS